MRRFKSAASPPGDVRDAAFLIVFGTTAVTLFLKGVVRVSAVHMLLGIVPALVVSAILVDLWRQRRSAMRLASAVVLLLALVPAASEAATELHEIRWVSHSSIARWLAVRAGLITLPAAARDMRRGPGFGNCEAQPGIFASCHLSWRAYSP